MSLFTRRTFIKSLGSAALLSAAPTVLSSMPKITLGKQERPRIALFYDEGFPSVDFQPVPRDMFLRALEGFEVVSLRAGDLSQALAEKSFHLFITPYGSAFPEECVPAIHAYLARGGAWINLGGRPLSVPVVRDGNRWRQEVRQISYHRRLGITQTFPVPASGVTTYRANEEVDSAGSLARQFTATEFYALYVRFTENKDLPAEDGSSGPRDAILTPLIHGLAEDGTQVAAPIIMIDRLQGTYAGGRWLFATLNGGVTPACIRSLAEIALRKPIMLYAQPSFACYHDAEIPRFAVRLTRPGADPDSILHDECSLTIVDRAGDEVAALTVPLAGTGMLLRGEKGLKRTPRPGLYRVHASLRTKTPLLGTEYTVRQTNGFWVYDSDLMNSGETLSPGKDLFLRAGEPYPVTGTTYMGSDVHRKFLLEPNPSLWDHDFREMREAGVNMVRTGIWTGWKNYMLDAGAFNDVPLRSLDAFFLTARSFDLPVIFTFFAFFPEAWGGQNPYLDPRAVAAQKMFLETIARRYRSLKSVAWDLINEPSFSSPARAWQTRPNYDPYETGRWQTWLRERMAGSSRINEELRERWRTTHDDLLGLPSLSDFDDAGVLENRKPLKVLDYRLFAQEMFIGWVKEMTAGIRSNGNSQQMITVGQDEGGTLDRPAPQFFSPHVDFTCNHTWWMNDDLVWDSVVTKSGSKPNLIEETGIMFSEKLDGSSARTEEEMRNLLERKLAIAAGTASAGFIQWIWNTNCYMPSDNEASIGFLRADGSAKPELEVFRRTAAFLRSQAEHFREPEAPPVLMIIPHSNLFSVRDFATAATKRCVRVFSYNHGMGMEACSEYALGARKAFPPLIVVPSPAILRAEAWTWLMSAVDQGSTLLITGPVDFDEYWRPVERSKLWGVSAEHRLVAQEEDIVIGGRIWRASYRAEKMHKVQRAVLDARTSIRVIRAGKGVIYWAPLPLELADSVEPTVVFYELGLKAAALAPEILQDPPDPSLVVLTRVFRSAVLCTIVSEASEDKKLRLTHGQSRATVDVVIPAQRAVMLLLDRATGMVKGRSGG